MSDAKDSRERVARAARESYEKFGRWIKEAWAGDATDHLSEQKYVEALGYFESFQAKEGADYVPAVEFMKESLQRHIETDRVLDEKADSIVKYLGGGAAVVTAGTLFSLKTDTRSGMILGAVVLATLLPALICAVWAILAAVAVRKPRASAVLPDAPFAIQCAEHYPKDAIAINQWLILHPMCQAAMFRNLQKSRGVGEAHKRYILAMALLLLPVAAAAVTLACLAASAR